MRMRAFVATLMVATMLGSGGGTSPVSAATTSPPANPRADAGAKATLAYLWALGDRSTLRTISGQHIGNAGNFTMDQVATLTTLTGEVVGLIGADYDRGAYEYERLNAALIAHHDAGGMVSISMHADNPMTGGDYKDRRIDIGRLVTPGSTEHTRWRARLDIYARGLQVLEDHGVTVLLRPFHEMNCASSWWTYRNTTMTTARYKAMWRQMFGYLTNVKRLDNLLWVYSAHECDLAGLGRTAWYPGDAYVDVVGLSVYVATFPAWMDRRVDDFHTALPQKPFALTELGPSAAAAGSWDLTLARDAVRSLWPYARYFMFWSGPHALSANVNADRLLSDPVVANLRHLSIG